jgi:hypothetical protein
MLQSMALKFSKEFVGGESMIVLCCPLPVSRPRKELYTSRERPGV